MAAAAILPFPITKIERAQSCGVSGHPECATYWLHNGMLLVDGQKMSKSLGNFITVQKALEQVPGEVIRWALLTSHYRHALDWTSSVLHQARMALNHIYGALEKAGDVDHRDDTSLDEELLAALEDDLNTPQVFMILQKWAHQLHKDPQDHAVARRLKRGAQFMGFVQSTWRNGCSRPGGSNIICR